MSVILLFASLALVCSSYAAVEKENIPYEELVNTIRNLQRNVENLESKTIRNLQRYVENLESKTISNLQRNVKNLESKTIRNLQSKIENLESKLQERADNMVGFTFGHTSSEVEYQDGNTIQFKTEITNYGAGYDATNGVFKCPVTGYYYFTVTIDQYDMTSQRQSVSISVGGTELVSANVHGTEERTATASVVTECILGTEVKAVARLNNGKLKSESGAPSTHFTGFLIELI